MCKMASFIVTKQKVYWSKITDSHEEIIREFGIKEQDVRKEYIFVRVEIAPIDDDYEQPTKKWAYKLDETNTEYLPKWYDDKAVEKRCRIALKAWYKACVLPANKTIDNLTTNIKIVLGTIESVYGNATIKSVYGNATIKYVYGNATIKSVYGNATIKYVSDNATITAYSPLPLDILKSANAVIVDRSGKTTVCYVGVQKTK